MNVYVRELAAALARAGVDATVFVRRGSGAPATKTEVEVAPGFRVVHVDAGPPELAKEALPAVVDAYTAGVRAHLDARGTDVLHANYWLSAVAGHWLKHQLDLPSSPPSTPWPGSRPPPATPSRRPAAMPRPRWWPAPT